LELGFDLVGMLGVYGQQERRAVELAEVLDSARQSLGSRALEDDLPKQNALHRSVVKLIIADFENGASTYEIASRYQVRRNTVRDTLRKAGLDSSENSSRLALTPMQEEEIRERYARGFSRRELAELFGVSLSPIRRVLSNHEEPCGRKLQPK
jgi:DNA invertase Pin-like site-specific DNA recombinase